MITGRQIRAARGLLRWRVEDLAKRSGLTREAITRMEDELTQPRGKSIAKIVRAFSEGGVEFIENQGVRFKSHGLEVFEGRERLDDFYDFLYEHLKKLGGEVCLSVVDERLLAKYRKDPDLHRRRMKTLVDRGDVNFRILTTESDFVSEYAKYKWIPKQSVAPTSFYAFGDCLALISFVHNPSPYIVVVQSAPIAEAYRFAFNIAWENAKDPATIMKD